ncbi:MAG: ATP-binding protein [Candidatus Omnitrophota bacterium]
MSDNKTNSKFITSFIAALNKLSLYPETHPLVTGSLKEAYQMLEVYLQSKKEMTFSISAEDKILLEGEPVASEARVLLESFVSQFKKLQAESITFSSGITFEELRLFLKTLSLQPKDFKESGGIQQVLANKAVKHIKVNLFSYVKIEKDKVIVEVGKGEKVAPIGLPAKLKGFLGGELDQSAISGLNLELHNKFLKAPIEIISLIKEISPDITELSKILSLIGDSLVKQAQISEVKSKIKLSITISKFYRQLQKIAAESGSKDQADKIRFLISERSLKDTDSVLLDAMKTEYLTQKVWTPTLKSIAKKLFSKIKDKNKKVEQIKSFLNSSGLSQEDCGKLIEGLNKELESKPKDKLIKVNQEEFEYLKTENARLALLVKSLESTVKEEYRPRAANEVLSKEEFDKLQLENERLAVLVENMEKEKQGYADLKKEHKKMLSDKIRSDSIIRHMADGLVVVDPQGKILMLNPAAEELLSVKKKDVLGGDLRKNIRDEHLMSFTKDLKPDVEGNLNKEIELVSTDESTKKVLRTSSAVIENQDGKTVGMVTILNDVTKQKELEKLKSNFVSHVSHELKTPLSVIKQSLSILNSEIAGSLNEDQKKFFSNSLNNLDRLRSLIADLLDAASIEAGKLKLKQELFDINQVVKGVLEFLNKWAMSKNIILEGKLLASKKDLFIDKDRITQVITNLVGNAIKFTPEGGTVTVALKECDLAQDSKQPAVEVSVSDTGIGIEEKDLGRIFNKFEQVNLVQPAGIVGTGLGLTIAKEIVQMHQGRIWVESKVGQGSKFLFLIPEKKEEVING